MASIAAFALALDGYAGAQETYPGSRGAASTRTAAYSATEFWGNYRTNAGLEVKPAKSLDDLYERSELIVLGYVVDAEAGPSNPVRLGAGTDANATTILTVAVDEVLAGPAAKQVKVGISSTSRSASDAPSAMMPADQLVWYLRPSEEPGIMYATAHDGIIGSTVEGRLTTVLGGTLGEELFPASMTTLEELAESIAALKQKSAG